MTPIHLQVILRILILTRIQYTSEDLICFYSNCYKCYIHFTHNSSYLIDTFLIYIVIINEPRCTDESERKPHNSLIKSRCYDSSLPILILLYY